FVLLFEVLLDVARSGYSGLLYRLLVRHYMDIRASSMMNQECVKLDKFDGCMYTRWAEKMKFLLIVLKIYYVLDPKLPPILANPVPEPCKPMDEKKVSELEKQCMIRKEDETLCCGHIKNSLSDTLYDLYASVTNPRELWSALDFKYKTHEQGTNKYLVSKYLEFIMVEGKMIMEQVHKLQVLINKLKALSIPITEAFQVSYDFN
ncbi:copia-like retrotransposon, partial [Tanacetum coccineum]